MRAESKIGLLRDRILVDGRECEVRRGRDGWRPIVNTGREAGRVRYDGWRDRISIDSPHGSLQIRFRWRNTTFAWRGRVYRVGSMWGFRVTIFDGDRPVVEGTTTWSGVRFSSIAAEFRDVGPELAVGFGLRSQAIATAVIVGSAH